MITIPDTVETAIRLPEKEVKKELLKLLAAKLYEKWNAPCFKNIFVFQRV